MNREMKIAVKAVGRLYQQKTEGWDEMESCDAHFDGGEWSSPAWSRAHDDIYEAVQLKVSNQLGLDLDALRYAIGESEQVYQYHYFEALRNH